MRAKQFLASSLFICMLLAQPTLAGAVEQAKQFSDVPSSFWAHEAIASAAESGIVNGYSDGTFKPQNSVTKAHFIAFVARAFYQDEFDDTAADPWYMSYVNVLTANGVLDSAFDTSDINRAITRYDMAQVMYRLLLAKKAALPSGAEVADISSAVGDWANIPEKYKEAVSTCYAAGLLNGQADGNFGGENPMNRGQGCVVISRLKDYLSQGDAPVPAAKAISVSSYKGNTLKVGDRSGLIVSPSDVACTVTSSNSSVIAVEQVSGNWVAVAKSCGAATITATASGYTAGSLTLTVEADATTTQPVTGSTVDLTANMDIRQEMIQRINQVRRENGVAELTVNNALMDAAQNCSAQGFTKHNQQYEWTVLASYGWPYGGGFNLTWFSGASNLANIAQKSVTNWVNSSGHLQTMLRSDATCLGVGVTIINNIAYCYMIVGVPTGISPI
jgi:uncharacterized protein YkwD